MNDEAPLLVRADGDAEIGLGHLMRCLALTQAWQERPRARAVFMTTAPEGIQDLLRSEGVVVEAASAEPGSRSDARRTIERARQLEAPWVAVDGYRFDGSFQSRLKDAGLRLLWIDDLGHAGDYRADLVLNPGLGSDPSLYARRADDTRLLLGPRYPLLRREFRHCRDRERPTREPARRLLVTLGGADPYNATARVLEGVRRTGRTDLDTRVIAGPATRHRAQLRSDIARLPGQVQLLSEVRSMCELMAWADVAVSAAGGSVWELAFMGVPSLLLVLRGNQAANAEELHGRGVARSLGRAGTCDPGDIAEALDQLMESAELRAAMSRRGRDLVDGDGAVRAVTWMLGRPLRLRPARPADCEPLWRWANDPDARRQSFSTEAIPWQTHVQWFESRLADSSCRLFIAEDPENPALGQARLDLDGRGGTEISVSLAPEQRGRGLGPALIEAAVGCLRDEPGVTTVHAFIRPRNRASIRAFERAGFEASGRKTVRGVEALHYTRSRANGVSDAED